MTSKSVLSLICTRDGAEVWSRPIPEGESYLGRGEECAFQVEDDKLSRKHLRVRRNADTVYLENVSTFGDLKINGEAREHVELTINDHVSFGSYELFVRELAVSTVERAAASPAQEDAAAEPESKHIFTEPSSATAAASTSGSHALAEQENADPEPELLSDYQFAEGGSSDGRTVVQRSMAIGKLVVVKGPDQGKEFPLMKDEIIVGRSPAADVVLSDDTLSRKHFKITHTSGVYRIVDLESSNGTRVNGIRVIEQVLKSFDTVSIGDTDFRFLLVHREWGEDIPTQNLPVAAHNESSAARSPGLAPISLQELAGSDYVEDLPQVPGQAPPPLPPGLRGRFEAAKRWWESRSKRQRLIYFTLGVLTVLILLSVVTSPPSNQQVKKESVPIIQSKNKDIPDSFFALSEEERIEIEKHYNAAVTAYQQSNWVEVTKEANFIKSKIPFYKELDSIQAEAQKKLQQIDRENFDKISAEENAEKSEDIYYYLEEGDNYLRQGNFAQAHENYRKALEIDPTNEEARKGMKAAEAQQRDKDWEVKELDRKNREDQIVADVVNRGRLLVEAESFEQGISILESALKMSVHNSQIHDLARQWIDHAIRARRNKYQPDLVEAAELIKQRRFVDAYRLCEGVIKAVPDFTEARVCMEEATQRIQFDSRKIYRQGLIDEYLGNHSAARQHYQRILQSFPPSDLYYQRSVKKLKRYDPED